MRIVELSFTSAPERLAARPAHREKHTVLHEKWIARMAGPLAGRLGHRHRRRRTGPRRPRRTPG
ncbi:hypothetical protein [Streptomyces sp. NPDC047453]|uniref:hypothetical protein n=1 Tax=Streptomyces sp. NPDC047453 TaxID=3154812 RepID=UPI0033CD3DE2